jgi:hypothetical protein
MACWVGAPAAVDEGVPAGSRGGSVEGGHGPAGGRSPRTFVPVDELVAARQRTAVAVMERADGEGEPAVQSEPASTPAPTSTPLPMVAPSSLVRPVPGRWWLWGDPDPWPERFGGRWT